MIKPLSASGGYSDFVVVQKSRDRLLEGRGRSVAAARRAHISGGIDRDGFMRRWSLLMIASFNSREACACHFDVSFSTACNWFEGTHRPYGDYVDYARTTLPDFDRVMGGGL